MKNPILKSPYILVFSIFIPIILFPTGGQADAINPIFNLFTPGTILPASILTVLIIGVEGLLLWKWFKPISFRTSIWRATIINIISSVAGSIAAWLFFQKQMIFGVMDLYVPMFFLTLATETPSLKYLYRHNGFNWKQSLKISVGINITSYLVVFVSQIGLIFAYLEYADYADSQTLKEWNDLSLLDGETGYIYTIKLESSNNSTKYVFNRYNIENREWEIIDPGLSKGIYPTVWDIKGNFIACIIETGDWKNRSISVINTSNNSKIMENHGNFSEVRISPDLSKLAVLEYVRNIYAARDSKSSFMLGTGNKLKIYDIESGMMLHEAPRLALDNGLTWTNNSTLIFTSLRNLDLLQNTDVDTHGHTYGRSYSKDGQFPVDLFVYNTDSNSVRGLTEGQDPQFNPLTNEVSFLRISGFYNRDLWKGSTELTNPGVILSDIIGNEIAISPSGRKYLVLFPHKQPLGNSYFLTLVDPNDSENRFIVEPNSYYGFRWIMK